MLSSSLIEMIKDVVHSSIQKNDLPRIDSPLNADNLQSSEAGIILEKFLIRLVDEIICFNYYNGK